MPLIADLIDFKTHVGANAAKIMVTGSDATGDITHVYAAYKADSIKGLIIFAWPGGDAVKMQNKYIELGMPQATIKIVQLPAVEITTKDILENQLTTDKINKNGKTKDAFKKILVPIPQTREKYRDFVTHVCRILGFSVEALHDSTKFAALGLKDDDVRRELHEDLRGSDQIEDGLDASIIEYWKDAKLDLEKHVVVLWGRTSGKTKTSADGAQIGPHLYGDSSTTGFAQIAEKCLPVANVIVVGDFPEAKRTRFPNCVFLGAFWNDFAQYQIPNTQQNQIRLFYILKRILGMKNKRLVHVGMRSGNLDNFGFAGQNVVYIVPQGFDDTRILKLAIADKIENVDAKPSGGNRWLQSVASDAPRVAYRKSLAMPADVDPNIANVVRQTKLATFLQPNSNRFASLNTALKDPKAPLEPLNYPLSIDTDLNANIVYRAIKDAKKANADLDEAQTLLDCLDKIKGRRGFSEEYLTSLLAKIKSALTPRPEGKAAKPLNRAINM